MKFRQSHRPDGAAWSKSKPLPALMPSPLR